MKRFVLFILVEALLLCRISQQSGYEIRRPDFVVTLPIATMATPLGLLWHLLSGPSDGLYRFYFRISPRVGFWQDQNLTSPILAFVLIALTWLWMQRAARKP